MLIFVAFLYFCLACSVIWIALFPGGRASVLHVLGTLQRRLQWRVGGWQRSGRATLQASRSGARGLLNAGRSTLRRHWAWFAVGVPLVLIPTLLALLLRRPDMLPDYEPVDTVVDAQVAALLKGEQLVPPAALPPVAFSTREVELVRPMLVDASRNWGLLRPEFSQRLLLVFKIMKEKYGYEMALLEGYRSPARQELLAGMGSQVTNARAFQSWHQYGLAADCAFWRDGRLVISEKDPWAMRGYQLYGEVAESVGLTWGGRWTMMDFGHAELRMRGVMRH
ncbi:M15 family metallopeptidase [Massilia sp. TW-1]|uniref:M15 family metallopeptidase n=1 Tax=Telluria antibiotica TaxID=2717319 RepID=A0ABX0PKT7_9BURK|nr:M15 family metallopeptidase [Telluria antibiotica]NIA56545.1 M15 family metallopeptidase [Telluria antibiotica]